MMQAIRKISDEIYYTSTGFTLVGEEEIAFLKARAAETPRRRTRLCTHPDPAHPLHEMLIVHGRDAYVRPHRHHGKPESLHVMEGAATALLFDEAGAVTRRIALGNGGALYYRVEDAVFHGLLIESDWFVFHETTGGPFDPSRTEWAAWAPDGKTDEEAARYMTALRGTT
jgi:cupin fold WbuC family metalloprotein